jgi:hypothetical protein
MSDQSGEREVRLRPLVADLYPDISPGVWLPARQVAELLAQRARAARGLSIHQRTLDPRHFEFRGGPADPRPANARTRNTDR